MAIKDALLPEFDHEMSTTRRLLERVPADRLSWKPHERSMTMARLATHLGEILGYGRTILCESSFDLASFEQPDYRHPEASSTEEVLRNFDEHSREVRELLRNSLDGVWMVPWTLKRGSHEVFTLPRLTALRSMVLNHLIHHRGQLSVYLRLNDIKLPPIYGPTGDEPAGE